MLVSSGMPNVSHYGLAAGTRLSADYSALTDLMPAVSTRFQMGAVAGTPLVLTANLATSIPVTWPYLVIAMVGCTLPVGTVITLAGNNGWNYSVSGGLTVDPLGRNVFIGVLRQLNKQGSTAMTAATFQIATTGITNQQFNLGEIWVAPAVDIKLTDLAEKLVDPSWLNRSAGNQAWPVMRSPFRKLTCRTMPASFQDAFTTPGTWPLTLVDLLYRWATQKALLVIPRWRQRGIDVVTVDQTMVNKTGRLVRIPPDGIGELTSDASNDYWPAQLGFEELL